MSASLTVLFSGPSGTGKTMAAKGLAKSLAVPFYRIDLSAVVNKYVAETEKNLGRIFREAENANALLFIDGADALFGNRSEVKDAHDRHTNTEVAYLLQKADEFNGLVIMATHSGTSIEKSFLRRVHYVVEFSAVDANRRDKQERQLRKLNELVANKER